MIMSAKNVDFQELVDRIEKFNGELRNFEDNFKNHNSQFNNELKMQDSKINSFKKEINDLNEIINKTREYLLLELESNLDVQKQAQIKNNDKYDELIILMKDNNENKLLSLSE